MLPSRISVFALGLVLVVLIALISASPAPYSVRRRHLPQNGQHRSHQHQYGHEDECENENLGHREQRHHHQNRHEDECENENIGHRHQRHYNRDHECYRDRRQDRPIKLGDHEHRQWDQYNDNNNDDVQHDRHNRQDPNFGRWRAQLSRRGPKSMSHDD